MDIVDYHQQPHGEKEKLGPIHPSEVLRDDFMEPLGFNANRLAMNYVCQSHGLPT